MAAGCSRGGGGAGWGRRVRSMVGNSMGGLSGRVNLASWAVAGTLAYFLWIKPSQQLKKEQEERASQAAAAAASDPYRYVEKRKPIPDPQDTGLVYGNKNRSNNTESPQQWLAGLRETLPKISIQALMLGFLGET